MAVSQVTTEQVEGVDYKLFSDGKSEILIPASTVKSQLTRLTVDAAEGLVGKTVKFGRSHKLSRYGKPYWDIDLAAGAQPSPASNGKPPVSETENTEKPRLDRLYIRATRLVIDEVIPLYTKAGIGCSDTAVAAMAATIFIAATKEN